MKTLKKHLLTAALVCVALALPCRSAAASGQVLHMTFMGLTADASFDTTDPTGCIDTFVFISATNGTVQMNNVPGGPQPSSSFVDISQFNFCTETDLFEAFAAPVLTAGEFQIDRKLISATLKTSTDVLDSVSNTTFTVQISITWAAIPGTTPTASRFTFIQRGGGLRLTDSATAVGFEPATASGSVIAVTTTLASGESGFADLTSVKSGNLNVCIGPCLP